MVVLNMQAEDAVTLDLRILHLEDSALDHALVQRALQQSGMRCSLERVETLEAFRAQVHKGTFDVILADYRLAGFTALDAWEILQEHRQRPPFILLSGAIGEPAAVSAIKLGISDFLAKDDLGKLTQIIRRALEVHQMRVAKEAADRELALSERRLADLAEHLQDTMEQERAAIAREIHDDIGGSLAAIRFDLSWIARHTQDAEVLGHVRSGADMVQHALGASQRIMMNLRPAILDQGLLAALLWLTAQFEKRTGTPVRLRATEEPCAIPKSVQLVAYRTAQEALTNVGKHARCTQVQVELSGAEGVLTLEVRDDGQGIAAQDRNKPKSFGLRGLQERAKSVGGWVDISAQVGKGTCITLTVPLHAQAVADTRSQEAK